jgi:RNA polymerase sigma-70 factor (ECF subfamily)
MNILGHENPDGEHRDTEATRVDGPLDSIKPPDDALEASIVDAARRRDRARCAELLVTGHAHAIGRVCMALLGSRSEAEDALQETLVAALDGLDGFRGDGSLRAWLLSIARRRCARRLESRSRERELEQRIEDPRADLSAEEQSLARQARALLADVRPSEREALVLRFDAGLSFREVALACGIDEAAARKRVSRGLSRLRSLMGEDES